jgi:hypothetical protein
MKSVGPPKRPLEGEWRPSQVTDACPATSAHAPIPPPCCGSDSLGSSLPDDDPTRVFLHQLSQALTSLRGALELALLVDSNPQEYRRVIQQSLMQAEGLVQLFKAYRELAQGGDNRPCE